MSKEKKTLTPTQKKKKYKRIQYSCFAGEFISVAAPFIAIAIVNYDKYFVEYDGTKTSISFVMAMAVMGFAIWGITKKKLANSFVSMIIIWATMAFIFTMLGQIITDLATIMWFGLIGIVGAYGLDLGSNAAKKKKDKIIAGIEEAEKEITKDAYKEELKENEQKKTIKVRVKK